MNKHDWTYKKLGEVAEIVGGSTPKTGKPEYWNGTHFWVTPAELGSSVYIGKTERTITDKAVNETNLTLLPVGTVLLSSRAPIGKTAITTAPMYCNQGFKNIVCSDALNNKFVYHYITHIVPSLQSQGRGATFKEISKSIVEKTMIPVPSMEEQEAIVAELDEINEAIAALQQQVADLDALAQSTFYTMFGDPVTNPKGWEMSPLKESVDEMFLGPFGSSLKVSCYVPEEDSFAMVYEQKHAIQAKLDLDNHFIDKEKFDSLARFEVKPYDFIMSCRGTIGKIYQLPKNAPKGIIHPSLMKIRINNDIYDYVFFEYTLRKIIIEQTTKGNCVQMAITAKELGKMDFILPPRSLQQEFAAKVEAIESAKAEINAQIAEMQTLLASRMDYYFD